MKRRVFLASSAVTLAHPAIGAPTTTIIHVPQGNLVTLDPVCTTAIVTRNAAGANRRRLNSSPVPMACRPSPFPVKTENLGGYKLVIQESRPDKESRGPKGPKILCERAVVDM